MLVNEYDSLEKIKIYLIKKKILRDNYVNPSRQFPLSVFTYSSLHIENKSGNASFCNLFSENRGV